MTCIYYHTDDV